MTFREIIGLWGPARSLAEEINAPPETVHKWRTRGRIPASWWVPIIETRTARRKRLTYAKLAAAAYLNRTDNELRG